jgi:hypothetical protein
MKRGGLNKNKGINMNKNELLKKIQDSHRQLERYLFYFEKNKEGVFVAGSNPKFNSEEMLRPGVVGNWSLKDVLVCLIDWEQHFLAWYQTGLRGEIPETPTPGRMRDELKAIEQQIEETLDRSLENILAEFPISYQQILTTVQAIPEDDMFRPGRYAWTKEATLADYIAVCTFDHYDWAKKHIRKWRSTHAGKHLSKAKILEDIQIERRRLEKNLAELSVDEMTQPGAVGDWSVKDVLAHLIDWEQRFLAWYQAGLRGEVPETPAPGLTWGDLDILNQQIFEKHQDRTLADVLAEFHNSYQQVLATVQSIPEKEMFQAGFYAWTGQGNLVGYIRANTGNHYRWAKTQILRWMKARGKYGGK